MVNISGEIRWGKVQTTQHNLSIGVMKAIEQSAERFGLRRESLLEEAEIIRYSTTLALNTLLQRKGAKLGLLTTKGFEDLILMGRSRQWGDGLTPQMQRKTGEAESPEPLIDEESIVGINERTDSLGNVLAKPDRREIVAALRQLISGGVRGVVVAFLWSFLNPSNEVYVREVLEETLPEAYVGSLPVFLSSEVLPKWLEYPRIMTTVLTAYLQPQIAEQLGTLSDDIRRLGHPKPLMLVHNTGGMAKLSRTALTNTYNAGPVSGMVGSLHIGKLYGLRNIITAEMGGTTFNAGIISDGELRNYEFDPVIDRWTINVTMIENRSIGAGGGSIAWLNDALGGRLEVGPQSAGSTPGPACYDLGGRDPTVTDADLVLGYLNEKAFLGGRLGLNKEKASNAIRRRIAEPMGLTVEESAMAIRKVVEDRMGAEIFTDVMVKGHDPREFALFSFGGAGPVHAAGLNAAVGAKKIFAFRYGAVYDALGSSFLDLKHIYERTVALVVHDPAVPSSQLVSRANCSGRFNSTVDEMKGAALRDLNSEGAPSGEVVFALELDMRYENQLMTNKISSPKWSVNDASDIDDISTSFESQYYRTFGIQFPNSMIRIETIRLVAVAPGSLKPIFAKEELGPVDPSAALRGERPVFWDGVGFASTKVYDSRKLRPGNIVAGPAVVEADDTTYVVPDNMQMLLDEFSNFVMEAAA